MLVSLVWQLELTSHAQATCGIEICEFFADLEEDYRLWAITIR